MQLPSSESSWLSRYGGLTRDGYDLDQTWLFSLSTLIPFAFTVLQLAENNPNGSRIETTSSIDENLSTKREIRGREVTLGLLCREGSNHMPRSPDSKWIPHLKTYYLAPILLFWSIGALKPMPMCGWYGHKVAQGAASCGGPRRCPVAWTLLRCSHQIVIFDVHVHIMFMHSIWVERSTN